MFCVYFIIFVFYYFYFNPGCISFYAMELMLKELKTGMTQGELAKHAKLRNQMWRLELDGMSRKRKEGKVEWLVCKNN